jgi:hypothetical protein
MLPPEKKFIADIRQYGFSMGWLDAEQFIMVNLFDKNIKERMEISYS